MDLFQGEYLQFYVLGSVFVALTFGYLGAPLWLWTLGGAAALVGFGAPTWALAAFGVFALVFNIPVLRSTLVSSVVLKVMKALGLIPKISATERTALDAGVVWVEGDLFSGKPNFKNLLKEPYPDLTAEEKAFLDGPVERLCEVIDDWKVTQTKDIPKEVWEIIKKERFLGMIIPKEYGGLAFSALAHSAVIQKLATRSIPVTTTIMVPNSLGPAELLIHYGTEEQRRKLLPKLATGEEIPCFALTEPTAGSDAGSIQSEGTLFKGQDGKLYIKLNWNKRYITLAAIATTLGLAFRLKDPQKLLGKGEDVGITCALIPSKTPGVVLGRRHDPLGVPFYNCPTQGKDVVVLAEEAIIGGIKNAGLGWKMLMESLAAGRGISLPAQSVGGAKFITRITSNYGVIRKQFGTSIGKFEGIEELYSQIVGITYLLEAMRRLTLGGLDKGIKPPVITAIAKYNATELGRKLIIHGMDIVGGAGISRGPRNLLASGYIGTPIGITVEGANILTRTLMIFGQGALRAHPFAYREVKAVEENDLRGFDSAFWGHIGHVIRNTFRSILLSLTRGRLYRPPVGGKVGRYYQKLAWVSASFAIMSDIAMGSLGGALKVKEKITGRFADILSWMYIGFAVLRRYEAEGRREEDLPFVEYSMRYSFIQIQAAFDGIFANLPVPVLGFVFNWFIRLWSTFNSLGSQIPDRLGRKIAKATLVDSDVRNRLTDGIYIPKDPSQALGRLERAFKLCLQAEAIEKKIRKAVKTKQLPKRKVHNLYNEASERGIITLDEFKLLKEAEAARLDAVQVDDFSQDEYLGNAKGFQTGANEGHHGNLNLAAGK